MILIRGLDKGEITEWQRKTSRDTTSCIQTMDYRPENKIISNIQQHQDWISELRQANCSCLIIINNKTSDILFRTDFLLSSGMWRHWPEEMIKPMDQILFGSGI
jgi:hypothetical protein